jgi:hypothetical protein
MPTAKIDGFTSLGGNKIHLKYTYHGSKIGSEMRREIARLFKNLKRSIER